MKSGSRGVSSGEGIREGSDISRARRASTAACWLIYRSASSCWDTRSPVQELALDEKRVYVARDVLGERRSVVGQIHVKVLFFSPESPTAPRAPLLASCSTAPRVALRGIILGALHGPKQKTFPSYFSNQCPRTYAPKPAYAVRFWQFRDEAGAGRYAERHQTPRRALFFLHCQMFRALFACRIAATANRWHRTHPISTLIG